MLSVNYMEVYSIVLEHIQRRICHHKFYFLKKEPVKPPLQLSGEIELMYDAANNLTSMMDRLHSLTCKQLEEF